MSKISELSDGGSLQSTDYLIAVRSGGNVKVQANGAVSGTTGQFSTSLNVDGTVTADGLTVDPTTSSPTAGGKTYIGDSSYQPYMTTYKWNGVGSNYYASQLINNGTYQSFKNTSGAATVGAETLVERWRIASNGDISFYEDTGTTPKFFWDASAESLGIGTSSLSFAGSRTGINIKGTTSNGVEAILLHNTDTGNAGFALVKDGVDSFVYNRTNGIIGFGTNNTERMRIDASGNLLVGTTDNTLVGRADTGRVCIDNENGNDCIQLKGSGTDHLNIASWFPLAGGGFHIGFGDGTGSYTERGVISTNGSTTVYAITSDYRLKENIQPLSGAVERLRTLKPSRFNFIETPSVTLDGFIAHEVAEVVPEAVAGEKDGQRSDGTPRYQHLDAAKLVPLLTAALQEALTQIDDLRARVAQLEGA